MRSPSGSQECEPRWATQRTPSRPTFGPRIAKVAEALGKPLMPWQRMVAEVGGEMILDDETGLWVPAYPEILVTIMRQNGKTTLKLAWAGDRLILWDAWDGKPQSVSYTAQSGSDARQKFREDWVPTWKASPLWTAVDRPRYAAENSGLTMKSGGLLTILSNSDSAGHGKTLDLALMDEIFADKDNAREQATVPAMATRHDHQTLMASTAGDGSSTFLISKQTKGRAAVANGQNEGIAYFEWSADPDDDPEDPTTWWSCMPALGITITERTVRNAMEQMREEDGSLNEFRRAWLNLANRAGGDRVIPADLWVAALDPQSVPRGRCVLAVDGQPDQSTTSIALADSTGACEVLAHDDGVTWALHKLEAASKDLRAKVVVDVSGPVGHLADQLETLGVDVVRFQPRDVAHSCAEIFNRIADGRLRVRPNECAHCAQVTINAAVEGVIRQPYGTDGFRWSRKNAEFDISPLMAVTLAVGAASGIGGDKPPSKPLVAFT